VNRTDLTENKMCNCYICLNCKTTFGRYIWEFDIAYCQADIWHSTPNMSYVGIVVFRD